MSRRPPYQQPRTPTDHPLLVEAVGLHRAGRLHDAAKVYERIIAQIPRHFDATHLLGVVALQENRLEEAKRLIADALKINPRDASALGNLGTALLRCGELEQSCERFREAVKLQPQSVEALVNLGTVLRRLDRSLEALAPLRRAYSKSPKSAHICNLLGACLLDTGDASAGVKMFDAAVGLEPDNADYCANLAAALNAAGEHDRAFEYAEKAIAMNPDSSAAMAALAAVQFESGQVDLAIDTWREAVELPQPSTQTHCAFANALVASGLADEAINQLQQAIALDPMNAIARWKLAMAHCRPIFRDTAEVDRSRQAFADTLLDLQSWFDAGVRSEAYTAVGSNQPFFLAYQPFNNRQLLSVYGERCVQWMTSMPFAVPASNPQRRDAGRRPAPLRKFRIGIASAHVRDHSVWNAITKGWVEQLDKSQFDVHLFQLSRTNDDETARARASVARFVDQPQSLSGWIEAITKADLDVLIYPEIGMDSVTTQLASLRLVPVQAATWGHPETTGLPSIDLYLSADMLEPADAQQNYSERLVRLPNLGVFVEPLTPAVEPPDLQALGLPRDEPLLLAPGTPFKYSPLHDSVWVQIASRLKKKRGGRLVFFRSRNQTMDRLFEQRLRAVFKKARADFDARVCIVPTLNRARFFGLMQQSALLLDTLGFSGFNTALQAVECGLPVLAREGDFMRGRLASGIMRRMALDDLVAVTDDDFVQKAVMLAEDFPKREEYQRQIVERRAVLFRDAEPVRALERCLTEAVVANRGSSG